MTPATRHNPRERRPRGAVFLAAAAALAALHARAGDAPPPASPPKEPPAALATGDARPPGPAPAAGWNVTQGDWTLTITPQGDIVRLFDRSGRELVRPGAGDNLVRLGLVPAGRTAGDVDPADLVVCRDPVKADRTTDGAVFDYTLAPRLPLRVHYEIHFHGIAGFPAVKRMLVLSPDPSPFAGDLLVVAGQTVALPDPDRRVFVPSRGGIGEEVRNVQGRQWLWTLNGEGRTRTGPVERLALPMLSEASPAGALRVTTMADPYFAAAFRLPREGPEGGGEISWVYTGTRAPMRESESRTLVTVVHPGTPDEALRVWAVAGLADAPPGPAWLHDTALVHVDFLSRGGRGWFEDVDALERLIPAGDRAKVLLVQHGWYDAIGRYAFDERAGKLDDAWTAFPGAAEAKGRGVPGAETVAMTKAELHRRLAYAKERGFRTGLAFAEGLLACDGVKDLFTPDQVLARSDRTGPDQAGKAVLLNPLHPRVQARLAGLLRALLAEYGAETDALVWFETGGVREGAIVGGEAPGYAARALMRLVRDFAREAEKARPGLAFLAGDALGPGPDGAMSPPCAMVAHGCCPAGGFRPEALPCGLFPNLRNVLWPVPRGDAPDAAAQQAVVERYGAPVATSCGWGDAPGWAQQGEAEREALLALFRERAERPQRLTWLRTPAPAGR